MVDLGSTSTLLLLTLLIIIIIIFLCFYYFHIDFFTEFSIGFSGFFKGRLSLIIKKENTCFIHPLTR